GKLVSNDQATIYRAGALLCLLVTGAVGVALAAAAARRNRPRYDQLLIVAIFVLAPAVLRTIWFGHPEEDLGAALSIAAVLLAAQGRRALAGAALGVAIVNKPWALLAAPPVLLALKGNHRRAIATAGAIAAAWVVAI